MDTRNILNFFKTSNGKLVLIVFLIGGGLYIFSFVRPYITSGVPTKAEPVDYTHSEVIYSKNPANYNPSSSAKAEAEKRKKAIIEKDKKENELPELKGSKTASQQLYQNAARVHTDPILQRNQSRSLPKARYVSDLNLYTSKDVKSAPLDLYAPYGRLVKCELVNTVETADAATPIIGTVLAPVWNKGRIVIPVGTEVHGWAQGATRDKIQTQNNWILVWRIHGELNGKEMKVSGIALEDGQIAGQQMWSMTDGSAGIRGYTVDTTLFPELLMIASTFIAGAGQGMVKSTLTTAGSVAEQSFGGNWTDSIGQGANKAATLLAQRMLDRIAKNGIYVRAPAGTTFYLYITETISMNAAKTGIMLKENN